MIKIVNATPEHFDKINLRDCHKTEKITVNLQALTFLSEEQPIAIVGGMFVLPGVFQVWALISDIISKHAISFHKAILLLISYQFEAKGIRRMQMSVRQDFPVGYKWAKALGFNCEGIMQAYNSDGTNSWMFARVE